MGKGSALMRGAQASKPPFELERIEHVVLLIKSLERALAFYEDVLGAGVESRLPAFAMVELRVGASHLALVDTSVPEGAWALPPVNGGRNVDHIALKVSASNETALRNHLTAHEANIVEERVEENAGERTLSLYVRDPSGNTIELMGIPIG